MSEANFPWDLTVLMVHIMAVMAAAALFCSAPDRIQKLVLGLVMASGLGMICYYAMQLALLDPHWLIRVAALNLEHVGVLLYVFRLVYVERLSCKKLFQHSRPFQH